VFCFFTIAYIRTTPVWEMKNLFIYLFLSTYDLSCVANGEVSALSIFEASAALEEKLNLSNWDLFLCYLDSHPILERERSLRLYWSYWKINISDIILFITFCCSFLYVILFVFNIIFMIIFIHVFCCHEPLF